MKNKISMDLMKAINILENITSEELYCHLINNEELNKIDNEIVKRVIELRQLINKFDELI